MSILEVKRSSSEAFKSGSELLRLLSILLLAPKPFIDNILKRSILRAALHKMQISDKAAKAPSVVL